MVSQEELLEAIKEIHKYKKNGASNKECIKLLETAGYDDETIKEVLKELEKESPGKNLKEENLLRQALEKEEKINARTPTIKESIFSSFPQKKERVEEFEKSELQELPINDLILDEEKIDEHLNQARTKTVMETKQVKATETITEVKEKKGFGSFFKSLREKFKINANEKSEEKKEVNELKKVKNELDKEEDLFPEQKFSEEKFDESFEEKPLEKKEGKIDKIEKKFEELKKKLKK